MNTPQSDYGRFVLYAIALPKLPGPREIRRVFGCSITTAYNWLSKLRLGDQLPRENTQTGTFLNDVFALLSSHGEPMVCGQVAKALEISPETAMHALQNLFEAGRVERSTHSKPFTYAVPQFNRLLRLLMQAPGPDFDFTPSIGVVIPLPEPMRIAA
jgi:hypothetical protein